MAQKERTGRRFAPGGIGPVWWLVAWAIVIALVVWWALDWSGY